MTIIRKGALVRVEARVQYGEAIAGKGRVTIDVGPYGVEVPVGAVTVIEDAFAVGDNVKIKGPAVPNCGVVRGVSHNRVWVEHLAGFATYNASDLALVAAPADPAPVDPPLIETPPLAPYITGVEERTSGTLADRLPDLPHLADALADV